ncbi:hypothetical protein BYT27DRAFT_7085237 [Phlegmacium glaucopus]|nr:hypothetical protein BYT27DRAFT_7085237 [Phlegmacium glaucopus]
MRYFLINPSSPYTVDHLVDFLEPEYQMLMGDRQRGPNNDITVALAALSFQKTKVICTNCKRPGHSAPWCVCPNGGMAGKLIAESKEARQKDREAKGGPPAASDSSLCVQVSVRGTDGQAYLMYTDTRHSLQKLFLPPVNLLELRQ